MMYNNSGNIHISIRADGSNEIGLGHLYRSSVVADEALTRGHTVTMMTRTPEAARRVAPSGVDIQPLSIDGESEEMTDWVTATDVDAVVTDSYDLDTACQRQLSDTGATVAVLLDDTRHRICADVLINGNLYADDLAYEWSGTEPEWCLGTEYLLLREPFRTYATETQPFPESVSNVIVTMGGVDKENRTPTVLSALDRYEFDITAIMGPGFENGKEIRETAATLDCSVTVREDPSDLPELFLHADVAVCTLGTTTYELLATQTPIVGIPDNETPIHDALDTKDAALVLSREPTVHEVAEAVRRVAFERELRRSLWRAGEDLISGSGPANVIDAVEQAVSSQS